MITARIHLHKEDEYGTSATFFVLPRIGETISFSHGDYRVKSVNHPLFASESPCPGDKPLSIYYQVEVAIFCEESSSL
jgi:hypothetical protein